MSFDLSQVMQQAQEVKERQDNNEGGGNNLKLIYPQQGNLKVKLLFNPKSSVVTRLIGRHNVNGTKVPCLTEYKQDCPVCKTLTSIESAKGIDLWKFKKQSRGLAFAQYIESDYKWNKPEDEPAKGEVVLLMFPWSVYQGINRLIAEAGQMAGQLVASNEGKVVKIERWTEANQVKYSAGIDAWSQPYKSCETDAQFEELLNGLESLNDKVMPIQCTDEILKQVRDISQQLTRDYLSNSVVGIEPQPQGGYQVQPNNVGQFDPNAGLATGYQANPGFQPQQSQQGFQPTQPQPGFQPQPPAGAQGFQPTQPGFQPQQPAPQPTQQPNFQPTQPTTGQGGGANIPVGAPECYGQKSSGTVDPNKCLLCPHELTCQQA